MKELIEELRKMRLALEELNKTTDLAAGYLEEIRDQQCKPQ